MPLVPSLCHQRVRTDPETSQGVHPVSVNALVRAEAEGFEPSMGGKTQTALAGRSHVFGGDPTRPLIACFRRSEASPRPVLTGVYPARPALLVPSLCHQCHHSTPLEDGQVTGGVCAVSRRRFCGPVRPPVPRPLLARMGQARPTWQRPTCPRTAPRTRGTDTEPDEARRSTPDRSSHAWDRRPVGRRLPRPQRPLLARVGQTSWTTCGWAQTATAPRTRGTDPSGRGSRAESSDRSSHAWDRPFATWPFRTGHPSYTHFRGTPAGHPAGMAPNPEDRCLHASTPVPPTPRGGRSYLGSAVRFESHRLSQATVDQERQRAVRCFAPRSSRGPSPACMSRYHSGTSCPSG